MPRVNSLLMLQACQSTTFSFLEVFLFLLHQAADFKFTVKVACDFTQVKSTSKARTLLMYR